MSGDREARALAAGECIAIQGDDGREVQFRLRPIAAQHLCDLERDALKFYKRQYLSTFAENSDLLNGEAAGLMSRKMEEVAGWDLENLPKKTSYSAEGLPVTPAVRALIAEKGPGGEEPADDDAARGVLTFMLDTKATTPDEVARAAGKRPAAGTVRYDQWWVTARLEGMVAFILASVRHDHPAVTREEVARWPLNKIVEAAQTVQRLSVPALGNM